MRGSSSGRLSFALGACGVKGVCGERRARTWRSERSYGTGMERGRVGETRGRRVREERRRIVRGMAGGNNKDTVRAHAQQTATPPPPPPRGVAPVCAAGQRGRGPGRRTYPGSLLHLVLEIIEPIEELVELLPLGRHGEARVWWCAKASVSRLAAFAEPK